MAILDSLRKDVDQENKVAETPQAPVVPETPKVDRSAFNCPLCHGEGLQDQYTLCPSCGGTGKA